MLVPFLAGFCMAKCVRHCIGKYIQGSVLDDALVEAQVFGKKVIEQMLNGTHYIRSLRAILILVDFINRLKWESFWENNIYVCVCIYIYIYKSATTVKNILL